MDPHERSLTILCPCDDTLRNFLDGNMPVLETELVASHIDQCVSCQERMRRFGSAASESVMLDPILRAVRCGSPSLFQSESACRNLQVAAARIPSGIHLKDSGDVEGLPVLSGRYRLIEEIGRGAFGRVYRALDPKLNCDVAIKVLHNGRSRSPLLHEAQTVAQLRHPHIVSVLNVSEDGEPEYIVMTFVNGRSLKERLQAEPLPVDVTLKIMISVCEAVACAHAAAIIHRDLKPANILLDQNEHPFVTDFGLAFRRADSRDVRELAGTPEYMSPEQVRGDLRNVDERSDIWSLGATMFAMLTGQSPFRRDSVAETLRAIREEPCRSVFDWNSDVPAVLDRIRRRCLAGKRSERYQTVNDLLQELRAVSAAHSLSFAAWARIRLPGSSAQNGLETHAEALRIADARYGSWIAIMVVLSILLYLGPYGWYSRSIAEQRQAAAFQDFLRDAKSVPLDHLPRLLKSELLNQEWFSEKLQGVPADATTESDRLAAFRLNLVCLGRSASSFRDVRSLLLNATADEIMALGAVIRDRSAAKQEIRDRLEEQSASLRSPEEELRYLAAKWVCRSQDEIHLEPDVVSRILLAIRREEFSSAEGFARIFLDARGQFLPILIAPDEGDAAAERLTRAWLIWADTGPLYLELLRHVPDKQLRIVFEASRPGSDAEFCAKIEETNQNYEATVRILDTETIARDPLETQLDQLAEFKARLIAALCAGGNWEVLRSHLTNSPDPRVRTNLIHMLQYLPGFSEVAGELLESNEPTQVSATVLALGGLPAPPISADPAGRLTTALLRLFEQHSDPGVHSAACWLLRKWQLSGDVDRIRKQLQQNALRPQTVHSPAWIEHESGLALVLLPAADLRIGSPPGELGRFPVPQTEEWQPAAVTRPFAISCTEITVGNLRDLFPEQVLTDSNDSMPAEVSGNTAIEFCRRFGQRWNCCCRLPTGVEWEYACRAGTVTTRFTGYSVERFRSYAVFQATQAEPVALRPPNAYGLFDILGNLAECTVDNLPGRGASSGLTPFRGGYWTVNSDGVRAASRFGGDWSIPTQRGFRIILEL